MSTQISLLLSPNFRTSSSFHSVHQSILSRERKIGCGLRFSLRCNATPNSNTRQGSSTSISSTHEINNKKGAFGQCKDVFQRDHFPLIKWPVHNHDHKDRVDTIKSMLRSMSDGEISVSPYDTAWVALVKDINGYPQFPSSVEWIVNNQLEDGSWGDKEMFAAHDRIMNTLACVIALTTWNIHPHKCDRGMEFIRENLRKLGEEKDEQMPIGFEVVFPSLIEIGRDLGIQLLDHSGVLQHIYSQRNIKLQRIPKEILHSKPTSLLHSLEGMSGLEWEKLMKLQSKDGSFLFSPASTAFALMQTRDLNCFRYLENAVSKFNGGVPNVYPVDMFEHIWVVDRLQRLGISRFFKDEINECIKYVHEHWTEKGICWARNSEVQDIDDTAMGFRLLRLHGYNVSPGVFENFKKNGEFFCFAGQSTQAVTGMYNLLRASELQYPGEGILEEARMFSSNYLTQKRACNQLFDKWIIMKDLPGEVGCALDLPWYANLPRIETRFYIEHYGGDDDVWIGKTLYRMPYVSNNIYLELAKSDFNTCQALHILEWDSIRRWYDDYNLKEYGLSQSKLLRLYFVAAASIFEPESSNQRLAWAKTTALVEVMESHCRRNRNPYAQRRALADEFLSSCKSLDLYNNERKGLLLGSLQRTLGQLSLDVLMAQGVDISDNLRRAWEKWMVRWVETGDRYTGEAELLAQTIQACTNTNSFKFIQAQDYQHLVDIANRICQQLGHLQPDKHMHSTTTQEVQADERSCGGVSVAAMAIPREVNEDMQRLGEMVFSKNGLDANIKLSFWEVARTYYYTAYCSPTTINTHLAKVMFERVASS